MFENRLSVGISFLRDGATVGSIGRDDERVGRPPVANEIGRSPATGTPCGTGRSQSVGRHAACTSKAPNSHNSRLLSSSRWTRWIPDAERGWRAGLDHTLARIRKTPALPAWRKGSHT